MPRYEYRCKACGEDLEVVQSFTDDPLTTCPTCGGELRKVFGVGAITFKGSGFYRTDSRSGSRKTKTGASADKSGDSSSSSSSESSSDSGSGSKSDSTSGNGKKAETKKSDPSGSAAKTA
jgi:putative FmdB family regulatory protein